MKSINVEGQKCLAQTKKLTRWDEIKGSLELANKSPLGSPPQRQQTQRLPNIELVDTAKQIAVKQDTMYIVPANKDGKCN